MLNEQFVEQDAEGTRPDDPVAALPTIPGTDGPHGSPIRPWIESDSLGSMEIPADALWGVETARALENFPISRRPISVYRDLIRALGRVKQTTARANKELGVLDAAEADLIERACEEILGGALHEEFAVGAIKGGAGASTDMNTMVVIANRGLEMLGYELGDYSHVHPLDDVNRSQSTNDVYPTATKLAMAFGVKRPLKEHRLLSESFR